MSQLPFYLLAFAGVLGVLIVVHEYGHYLAARWCGVKVLRFSVGFGKPLFSRRWGRDGTEWVLAAFPLGGYVKMLDEREAPVPQGELARAFNRQSVGKRSLIVAAGPLANLLAAVLLYWGVFFYGSQELLPVLGEPPAASAAAQAGIADGEQVIAIDGEPVASYGDFRWLLLRKAVAGAQVDLELVNAQREHRVRRLDLSAADNEGWTGDPLEHLGIRLYRPIFPPVIGKLIEGSAGEAAGLRSGDRILSIDGLPIAAWHEVVQAVRAAPGRTLHIAVQRDDQSLTVDAIPEAFSADGQTIGRLGIAVADDGRQRELRAFVSYGFLEAGGKALRETWEKSWFSLQMLGKMLVGQVSWRNLSGPVTIADYAGQSARMGADYYLKFMALVSISLGVLNLLPIPVLDGGHLMYHMIEVVRRRPLSERALERAQQVGLFLLAVLMAFAFFNDLNRLVAG